VGVASVFDDVEMVGTVGELKLSGNWSVGDQPFQAYQCSRVGF
jgi:hypothetical protein